MLIGDCADFEFVRVLVAALARCVVLLENRVLQ